MSKKTGGRALDDWVEGFLQYTSMIPSPKVFRRWAAYSTIAGVLERRVWTNMAGKPLHPNLIVLLIAGPGVGKSMAIDEVCEFWVRVGELNVGPSGLTKAALLDQVVSKTKTYTHDGVPCFYNACLLAVSEFGNLLPEYDGRFLNVINDIYDCKPYPYEDRTRSKGMQTIDRAHITIFTGTQPKYFGRILPDAAFGMGFTSRTIMVYAGKGVEVDLFTETQRDFELRSKLDSDLKQMVKLVGEFEWTDDARDFVESWNRDRHKDAPTHPKLLDYNPRRVMHAVKIAMSISVSRNNKLLMTLDDITKARALLLSAEKLMPQVFKEMTVSQDASEIEEIHIFLFSYCREMKVETVPEHALLHFMSLKVPVNKVDYFIKTMLGAGLIKSEGINLPGKRVYRPMEKTIFTG